jgi:hypothetical protein
MRRPMIIATAAGGLLAAGLAAGPALAAGTASPTPSVSTCPCDGTGAGRQGMQAGWGHGQGQGQGYGARAGMGSGRGPMQAGVHATDPLAGLTQGTLTAAQKSALAGMAEEEKLAHDVYTTLAATTKDARFTRIATAEERHLTEIRALLKRYQLSDPTAGKAAGQFASGAVQQQYRDLVARGSTSLTAALAVGRNIETADLAALAKARTGLTAPDALAVYDRLTAASQAHLRAFGR